MEIYLPDTGASDEKREYEDMLKTAIKAAKESGKILMSYYGKVKVSYSGKYFDAAHIFTKADYESGKKIIRILKKEFPNHNIHCEIETKGKPVQIVNNSKYSWYIDPLDGTNNFTRGIPLFGISIGLIKDNQSILGVLYFPALDLLVYAEKGKGAFANGKRIKVSNRELKKSLYMTHGYFKGKPQLIKRIADKVGLIKIIDASSFELAQIAIGNAELYILESVMHDVAAGVIIVKEAGGKVTDYNGTEWRPASKGIVVSNRKIHNEVLKLLNKR